MIELTESQAKTAWFALKSYKERLESDLRTKYDGNPKFGEEDEKFLQFEIAACNEAIDALTGQGVTY
jgi:hypothetical protein